MPDERHTHVLRVVKELLSLLHSPGIYGSYVIKVQDSTPVYMEFVRGQRVAELPDRALSGAETVLLREILREP